MTQPADPIRHVEYTSGRGTTYRLVDADGAPAEYGRTYTAPDGEFTFAAELGDIRPANPLVPVAFAGCAPAWVDVDLGEALPGWRYERAAGQPEPAAPAGPEVLMAAIACMAERMASSTHRAGAAAATGGDYRPHLNACTRQRNAMYRLMDALAALQGAAHAPSWRIRNTLMTIAQHKRAIAKGA